MNIKTTLLACAIAIAAPIAPAFAEDTPNYIEDMKRWQPKAEAGDAEAQFQQGQMYALGHGFKQNFNSALEWYEKAAAQGNAKARTALGLLYYYGVGVEENTEKASEWFEKAAAQDEPNAQRYLGIIAYKEKDYSQAKQWWEQAAAKGYAPAMANIGGLYEEGKGVTQNFTEAKHWYEKGVKQDRYAAMPMNRLAQLYLEGKGVTEDEKQAVDWLEKSCALDSLGSGIACYGIGHAYWKGELGLPKDAQKAFEYAMKAAMSGEMSGGLILYEINISELKLSDADREYAIEFADNFRNKQYWKPRILTQILKSLQG